MTVYIEGDNQGLGDLVCRICAAQGYRDKGIKAVFCSDNGERVKIIRDIFGFEVQGGARPANTYNGEGQNYNKEIGLRIQPSRAEIYGDLMPHNPVLRRPESFKIPEDLREWARRDVRSGEKQLVLVFPYAAWVPRSWPVSKWMDLSHGIRAKGPKVVAMLESQHQGVANAFPVFFYGMSVMHLLAAIAEADLVISNDSGPAHVAGAMGKKALVVAGPTVQIFNHYETVEEIRAPAERVACSGCGFKFPYRRACDHFCEALLRLKTEEVERRAVELLEGAEVKRPWSPPHHVWDLSWIKHRGVDVDRIREVYYRDRLRIKDLWLRPLKVVDLNAGIGEFSRLALDYWPECEVVATGVAGPETDLLIENLAKQERGTWRMVPGHEPWRWPEDVGVADLVRIGGNAEQTLEGLPLVGAGPSAIVGEWRGNRERVLGILNRRFAPRWRVDIVLDGHDGVFRAIRVPPEVPTI